jgi:predicted secreted protein
MSKRRRAFGVIAGMLITLIVVAAAAWSLRTQLLSLLPTPPVVITERDYGTTVNLLQGQRLEVRLPSNRNSSSVWRADIPLGYLPQDGQATFTEAESPAKVGDGYQSTFFRATGAGRGPLFLSYLPKENQNSYAPSKAFRVVVIVR